VIFGFQYFYVLLVYRVKHFQPINLSLKRSFYHHATIQIRYFWVFGRWLDHICCFKGLQNETVFPGDAGNLSISSY